MDNKNAFDFEAGEVLLFDKPLEWTSFNVVAKVRNILTKKLKRKKLKVGHAGTLDPLATGLLIICTGKKTKEIQDFMGLPKTYTATVVTGATTASYDLESEVIPTENPAEFNRELLDSVIPQFKGMLEQTPPIFSAKKIDGKKAYDLARDGQEPEMKKALVSIHELEVTRVEGNEFDITIECSKGTYIRSLAHDLGAAMQTGAYLKALRRTAIGPFQVDDAWQVTDFEKLIKSL